MRIRNVALVAFSLLAEVAWGADPGPQAGATLDAALTKLEGGDLPGGCAQLQQVVVEFSGTQEAGWAKKMAVTLATSAPSSVKRRKS